MSTTNELFSTNNFSNRLPVRRLFCNAVLLLVYRFTKTDGRFSKQKNRIQGFNSPRRISLISTTAGHPLRGFGLVLQQERDRNQARGQEWCYDRIAGQPTKTSKTTYVTLDSCGGDLAPTDARFRNSRFLISGHALKALS